MTPPNHIIGPLLAPDGKPRPADLAARRAWIMDRHREGASAQQIATALKISPSTVQDAMRRGRKAEQSVAVAPPTEAPRPRPILRAPPFPIEGRTAHDAAPYERRTALGSVNDEAPMPKGLAGINCLKRIIREVSLG